MSIQFIHVLLYLGTSNPLQGQVGERPHQHVEPLLVLLRGPQHGSIGPPKCPLPHQLTQVGFEMSIEKHVASWVRWVSSKIHYFLTNFFNFLKKILNDRQLNIRTF